MRDIERIKPTLKVLEDIWMKYPDLRLGQLIENVFSSDSLYYIEDKQFIEKIAYFYGVENE